MPVLRGRGRPDAAPAEGPHLGPPRPHPVAVVSGKGSGRGIGGGNDLLQARCPEPVLLPDPRAHRPQGRAPQHVRSRLRRPGHRRTQPAPCPADSLPGQPQSRTKMRQSRRGDTDDHHAVRLALAHRCSSQARLTSGTSQARNSCAGLCESHNLADGQIRHARRTWWPVSGGVELDQSHWSARRPAAQLQRQPSEGKARRRG